MQTYIPLPPDLAAWQRSVLQSSLTPVENNCAIALSTFVDDRLCLAWPSMKALGSAIGKSEQDARSAVRPSRRFTRGVMPRRQPSICASSREPPALSGRSRRYAWLPTTDARIWMTHECAGSQTHMTIYSMTWG